MSDAQIKIDYVLNSSEFNSNMAAMKKNMQLCNEEVKNSAKEVELYGSNIKTLTSKQQAIVQAMEQSKKIMNQYSENIEKNKKALEENKVSLENLSKAKKEANNDYKAAIKAYGEESDEAQKLKETLDEVSQEYENMKTRIKGNENTISSQTAQFEKQRGVLLDLQTDLKKTTDEIDRQSDKFAEAAESFTKAGNALEESGGNISDLGGKVQTAGALIGTAGVALGSMALETDKSLSVMSGRLGLTAEETENLKEIARELYSNGFGESLDDCVNDLVLLQQNVKATSDVTDTEKMKLLEHISTIKTLFGAETEEITKALNNMMANGIISDLGEGLDLITTGFQNGLNVSGDFLDVLYEYSPQFKKLGLDGETALGMIKAGLDAGGYNADKMADALKEISIRAIDSSDTTIEGFTLMGLNADEMSKKFAAGGDSAKEALTQTLQALGKMEDPIAQDLAAVDLFGTQWEDSSKQAILAMADIGDGIGDITDATEKAGEEINNSLSTKLEVSMRKLKDSLQPLGEALLPILDVAIDGIGKLTEYISKLSPETVKAVAKFGAMAIAMGTTMKATGSLVTVLGKGANGISTLMKLASDTKSLGSFTKALGQSDTAIGGLVKSSEGITKVFSGFSATGGIIGGAIAAVAALGFAFYENQKSCEEGERALSEMGDSYEDFTGRVRTQSSKWSEIFGTEYTLKFSDQYKDALANSESEVASWVETLKGYQQNIYDILNNTEIDQGTKEEQVKELISSSLPKIDLEGNANELREYLSGMNWDESDINKYVESYKEQMQTGIEQIDGIEEKGLELLMKHTTTTVDEMGNTITEVDFEGFSEDWQAELDKNSEVIINMTETTSKDMAEQAEKGLIEYQRIYGDSTKGTLEARQKELEEIKRINLEKLQEDLKYAQENHASQATIDNINRQIFELNNLEQVQKLSLGRRAMYDQEYAQANGVAVNQISEGMWQVQDTINGTNTVFFDNEQRMTEWANTVGYATQTVTDEFGNTHQVVVDAGGGIVAMLDEGANTFGYFGSEATSAMQQVIDQAGVTEGTADQKFAAICAAIDDGTLSAQSFGLTDQEFYQVARAMADSSGDAETLTTKIKDIPKNTDVKVETEIEGESDLDDLITKLGRFAGKVFTATAKVVGEGIDIVTGVLGKKETGGTIQESGIYNINEAGVELVDSFGTSTASNYSLGDAVRGEYAYLNSGTKVTNALMTTQKMSSMIDSKLEIAMSRYMSELNRNLLAQLKNLNGDGFEVNMYNPSFIDKGSENANISNIKRIVSSMK